MLLSINDEGQHGQYIGSYSSCAEQLGDAFVFAGTLPQGDIVCDTSPLPAETTVFSVAGPVDGVSVKLRGPRSKGVPDEPNALLQQVLDESAAAGG